MERIAIFGAGGLGREILMLIKHINLRNPQFEFIGFFDDKYPNLKEDNDLPIIGNMQTLNDFHESLNLVVAIGHPAIKRMLIEKITNTHIKFPILIHPDVQIEHYQNIRLSEGCIITAGNILTVDITIGRHVLLNLNCTIGHDAVIGDYSALMPGVQVSGNIKIEEAVFVGTGAMLIRQSVLGQNAIIGAGAVVREDVPANLTVVGVPAVPIKKHRA